MTINDASPSSIHVLIPTAGERPELLKQTLEMLARCDHDGLDARVVVIENYPERRIEPMVRSLVLALPVAYLHEPVAGKSRALNRALEGIHDGLVVFLDDDVIVDPALLQAYQRSWSRWSEDCFFGGGFTTDVEAEPAWLRRYLSRAVAGETCVEPEPSETVCYLGFNWAAPAEALHAVGGFDVRRGPGAFSAGQETDMQLRLLARGWRSVGVADATVQHLPGPELASPSAVLKRARRNARSLGMLDYEGRLPTARSAWCWRAKHVVRCLWWGGVVTLTRLQARLLPGDERRFKADWWRAWLSGLVEGYRYARSDAGRAGRPKPRS